MSARIPGLSEALSDIIEKRRSLEAITLSDTHQFNRKTLVSHCALFLQVIEAIDLLELKNRPLTPHQERQIHPPQTH